MRTVTLNVGVECSLIQVLEEKCSGKYLDIRMIKQASNSEYYITMNYMICTGHLLLFFLFF